MSNIPKIHKNKTPIRLHYIAEWADKRNMKQADIVKELNVDKGTVSKWFSGALPKETNVLALAEMFKIEPEFIFRHPDDDWLAKFFLEKAEHERERAISILKAAFPETTFEKARRDAS